MFISKLNKLGFRHFIGILLVCLTVFSLPACKSSYDKGYDAGYEVGYDSGYTSGHTDGYQQGETDGYRKGYATGTGNLIQENGSIAIGQGVLIALAILSGCGFYYFMVKNYRQPVKVRLDNWVQYWNAKWNYRRTMRELQRLKYSANDYSRIKAGTLVREAFSNVEQSVTDEVSRERVNALLHQAIIEVNGLQSEVRDNASNAIEQLIHEVQTSQTLNHAEKVELYTDIQASIQKSIN